MLDTRAVTGKLDPPANTSSGTAYANEPMSVSQPGGNSTLAGASDLLTIQTAYKLIVFMPAESRMRALLREFDQEVGPVSDEARDRARSVDWPE